MIGRTNRPESEITRRINAIRASADTSFRGLLTAGEFDITSELRFRNLSGISFEGDDLRGIDFTGANIEGCDFSNALIDGARFELCRLRMQSSIRMVYPNSILRARDWSDYAKSWRSSAEPLSDRHLPVGAIFSDGPMLPEMRILPSSRDSEGIVRARIAISFAVISQIEIDSAVASRESSDKLTYFRGGDDNAENRSKITNTIKAYVDWATSKSGRTYRPVSEWEWDSYCAPVGLYHPYVTLGRQTPLWNKFGIEASIYGGSEWCSSSAGGVFKPNWATSRTYNMLFFRVARDLRL